MVERPPTRRIKWHHRTRHLPGDHHISLPIFKRNEIDVSVKGCYTVPSIHTQHDYQFFRTRDNDYDRVYVTLGMDSFLFVYAFVSGRLITSWISWQPLKESCHGANSVWVNPFLTTTCLYLWGKDQCTILLKKMKTIISIHFMLSRVPIGTIVN